MCIRDRDIGCIFITPCPAKVTAIHSPIGSSRSEVDGAVAIKEVYPRLLASMKRISQMDYLASAGHIGLGWAESGGEAAGLISTDSYLAADGIENVIRVLEDLEDEKYRDLDFVELDACAGGCVGGVLQVENPVSYTHLRASSAGGRCGFRPRTASDNHNSAQDLWAVPPHGPSRRASA